MKRASVAHYSQEPLGVIYGLHNGDRRLRYIGLTKRGAAKRLSSHKTAARSGTANTPLYRWMRKHGVDSIQIEIIEICHDLSTLDDREIYWISHYRKQTPDLLNVADGGKGFIGPLINRYRFPHGSGNPNYGKFGSQHPGYGRTTSEDGRRRLSQAKLGPSNPNYGKVYTEDEKKARSAETKGVPRPKSQRSAHTRWHTNKNVSKPETCKYCKEEIE